MNKLDLDSEHVPDLSSPNTSGIDTLVVRSDRYGRLCFLEYPTSTRVNLNGLLLLASRQWMNLTQ